jgi:hypothetical protein
MWFNDRDEFLVSTKTHFTKTHSGKTKSADICKFITPRMQPWKSAFNPLPASSASININDKYMTEVEGFIYDHEGSQREIMLRIHKLLADELNLTDKLRFKIPFYYRKSWICYLNPSKNNSVDFAFVRGNELSNSQGLLDNKGRKQVWSIELNKTTEIPIKQLTEIIQEAILLDETVAYASKRKKPKF